MGQVVRHTLMDFLKTVFLIILAAVFLLPFYVILRNAFATDLFIFSKGWPLWPQPMRVLANLKELFTSPKVNMWNGLKVSGLVAVIGTAIQLFIASIAGFGLARLKFKYKSFVLYLILFTMMIPAQVTFIPRYLMVLKMGMINTYGGIIIPTLFNSLAAFMYRQFFLDFPSAIEDSGKMDGLGSWGIWWRLAMPGARGITIALGIISFFTAWNSFLWPLIVGQTERLWTIQVIMSSFIGSRITILHMVFMGALVALLPIIILFFMLQRYIVQGVTLSAVKG